MDWILDPEFMDWVSDPGFSLRIHFVPSRRAPEYIICVYLWFLTFNPTQSLGKG